MNKRNLNLEKYGITGKRYKELCGFCEQYPEWIDELKFKNDTVRSMEITDMPICHNNSDATGNLAVKRAELKSKCKLVEETAEQAGKDLSKYIIKSVCYEVPVTYLIACEEMPISKSAFYEMRRHFFYLLDKNKKI